MGCGCGEDGPTGCDSTCGSTLELDGCGVCGGEGPNIECWDESLVCDESLCPIHTYYSNIEFETGWNWFSLNLLNEDMTLNSLLSSINGNSSYIKSQGAYADYYDGFGWWGTLSELNNSEMYKIDIETNDSLGISGTLVEIDHINIPIYEGWNWIGFPSQSLMELNTALSTIDGLGSYIKNQGSFSDYYDGFGWWGELEFLEPLNGYMLLSTGEGSLQFPSDVVTTNTFEESSLVRTPIDFEFNPNEFEYNGSMTIELELEDKYHISEGDLLIVMNGDEVCGLSSPVSNPFNEKTLFQTMIYGNESGFNIDFQYFNILSGELMDVESDYIFDPDMALGNAINTVQLGVDLQTIETDFVLNSVYPNPFNPVTNINFNIPSTSKIKISIYNLIGEVVEELIDGEVEMGNYEVQWDGEGYPSGLYIVSIKGGSESSSFNLTEKIILLK